MGRGAIDDHKAWDSKSDPGSQRLKVIQPLVNGANVLWDEIAITNNPQGSPTLVVYRKDSVDLLSITLSYEADGVTLTGVSVV